MLHDISDFVTYNVYVRTTRNRLKVIVALLKAQINPPHFKNGASSIVWKLFGNKRIHLKQIM